MTRTNTNQYFLSDRVSGVRTLFFAFSSICVLIFQSGCGSIGKSNPAAEIARMNEDKTNAHLLIQNERYEEARSLLTPWAEKKVHDPQVYAMLGKARWELGEKDAAVSDYEAAMRLDYSDANVHLELAELLVEMGKTGRALTEFELAIEYGRRDPLTHYNYGLALHEMDKKTDGLAQWEIAYSLDSKNPQYAEALGIGYAGEDDEKALSYFEQAAELGSDGASFHNNFGLLLQRMGDYGRSADEFLAAIQGDPGNMTYTKNLAILHMTSGRFGDAIPVWRVLFDDDPEDTTSRIYLARAYLESGQYDESVDLLENWIMNAPEQNQSDTDGPDLDEAYGVLAMASRGQKKPGKAAEFIRKALELKPDNPVYLNNYGVILAESGKIVEARTQWEKVLRLDPENATARRNLSAFEP